MKWCARIRLLLAFSFGLRIHAEYKSNWKPLRDNFEHFCHGWRKCLYPNACYTRQRIRSLMLSLAYGWKFCQAKCKNKKQHHLMSLFIQSIFPQFIYFPVNLFDVIWNDGVAISESSFLTAAASRLQTTCDVAIKILHLSYFALSIRCFFCPPMPKMFFLIHVEDCFPFDSRAPFFFLLLTRCSVVVQCFYHLFILLTWCENGILWKIFIACS